jgi:integrase
MAYIVGRKTKSGEDRFLVRYRDADTGRTLTSPVFTDRGEAEKYKASVEQQERRFRRSVARVASGEAMGGAPTAPLFGPVTADPEYGFAAWATRYIQNDRDLTEGSRIKYLSVVRTHFAKGPIGRLDIRTVGDGEVEAFWNGLADRDVGDGARRSIKAVLSIVIHAALRRGIIRVNPLDRLELSVKATNADDIDPLNESQIESLAAAAKNKRDRLAILLMGYGGLRASELGALRAADVDPAKCQLRIRQHIAADGVIRPGSKSASGRRPIGLASSVCVELREYIAEVEPAADGRIFTGENERLWMPKNVGDMVQHTAKRVPALRGVRVHSHLLRHSAASMLAAEGAGVREVQEFLGDSTTAAAMRYVHLYGSERDRTAQRMEQRRNRVRNGSEK